MLLLENLISVFTLSCSDFQTAFRLPKAWFALASPAWTSLPLSPSTLTLLPRYVNSSTSSICWLLMMTGSEL